MKVKYNFVNGDKTEIEVSEEIADVILSSRRAEHAQDERKRTHCYSLDHIVYEGKEYGSDETPESVFENKIDSERLAYALSQLTEKQCRRLEMYADGLSYRQIADREGVSSHSKISKSIEAAKNKIKKYLI